MATKFSLVVKEGPNPGRRVEITKSTFIIGRDPASDFHIQDIEISRRHARLIAQSGGYTVEDLGSTNGTFVNNERIRTITPLRPGDALRLGELVTLIYEADLGLDATPPSTQQLRAARAIPPAPAPAQSAAATSQPAAPARRTASLRDFERAAVAPPPPAAPVEPELEPAAPPVRRRERRKGLRLPLLDRRLMIGCAALLLLGVCASIAFFWYVDANYLWCDVFGGMIAACR
jgi:predicted component of type VI protein secretion system